MDFQFGPLTCAICLGVTTDAASLIRKIKEVADKEEVLIEAGKHRFHRKCYLEFAFPFLFEQNRKREE